MTDHAHSHRLPWLSPAARFFLRQRFAELVGLLLLLFGIGLILAIGSFHPEDPSLNRSTGGAALNLLGSTGAVIADLLLQSIGLAALLLALVPMVWGWKLLRHRRLHLWWLRLALLPPAPVTLAIALAGLSNPAGWPLTVGLGGYAGDYLMARLVEATGLDRPLVALAFFVIAMLLAYGALGIAAAGYMAAGRRTAGGVNWLSGLVARGTDRLRRPDPDAAAALRGQRAMEARERRLEPSFDSDEADDADFYPALGARPDLDLDGTTLDGPTLDDGEPRITPADARSERRVEQRQARPKPGKRARTAGQGTLDLVPSEEYQLPPLELVGRIPAASVTRASESALEQNARLLESVLDDFGVKGEIVKVRPGPVVTLYELQPAPGIKTSRVINLADDIARAMSAVSVRIAVVPGHNVIGIELPNRDRELVTLRELLAAEAYERTAAKLALVLGKDIGGAPIIVDLARMPHLLIAGTTGSGKSVAINTMILSLLYRLTPETCKFIMIDPKMLELSVYDGIPHLISPVVTEPRKAIVALKWVVREMEDRYRAMSKLGVRNIEGYNQRIATAAEKGERLTRQIQTGFNAETGEPIYEEEEIPLDALPYIVVVVDEMADLMLVAGKDIEAAIQRLAQMARAAGIHIIMATQRPSVDVITGTIKANFPTRISFHVTSKIDSRTILGEQGAEQLLGQGDMLYMAHGGRISRVHGPFVGDSEVEQVVRFLKKQGRPTYIEEITREDENALGLPGGGDDAEGGEPLYDQAVALVCRERKASTSFVQRYLQIGYNRAARIVERMEREGVVSAANHVGKREVLARNIEERE
ncbi:MAG: DNA translocase FtsK 4TM domain-containing protein [Dongiaceae bacterium]